MYKLTTKKGSYIFSCLEDVFTYLDKFEEIVLEKNSDYVKLYFIKKEGNE